MENMAWSRINASELCSQACRSRVIGFGQPGFFTMRSHTRVITLPQDIAFYEHFWRVFGCGLVWNLVYKRSWGFLELFFLSSVGIQVPSNPSGQIKSEQLNH
jgi:hypothetical protein